MLRITTVMPLAIAIFVLAGSCFSGEKQSAEDVFNSRILPIFRSEKPSSCIQCHLASVDLKNYILPSSEKTFLSLRDQGLINLSEPKNSKILTLIRMGQNDADEKARRIHEKTRRQELAAFEGWIEACCKNEKLVALPKLEAQELAAPEHPNEVIRHARKSRIIDSFRRHVFSQRMRCFPCHTPNEIDKSNPRHQAAIKTQEKLLKQYGAEKMEQLSFFKKTPRETMDALINRSAAAKVGDIPMLNLKNPADSLLVLKPISKLPAKNADGSLQDPSSVKPITHMGGLKMHPHDQSYKAIIAWIKDYANTTNNQYKTAKDLPADNWIPTQRILRVLETPAAWEVGTPVQLFVHRWNAEKESWDDDPIAFTQGTVTPRHIVNGALFLFRPKKRPTQPILARGNYQIRLFVDQAGLLKKDPTAMLGRSDFQGSVVLRNARWREGFRQAEKATASGLKK